MILEKNGDTHILNKNGKSTWNEKKGKNIETNGFRIE